jgi:hypothetical protein
MLLWFLIAIMLSASLVAAALIIQQIQALRSESGWEPYVEPPTFVDREEMMGPDLDGGRTTNLQSATRQKKTCSGKAIGSNALGPNVIPFAPKRR